MHSQAVHHNQPPLNKISRGGFGFSSPFTRDAKKKSAADEDWYIPYNGPFEPPRETPRREKARDSWGDSYDAYDEAMSNDLESRIGYHRDQDFQDFGPRNSSTDERKGRTRGRAVSVVSGQTASSGMIDTSRGSFNTARRSTVSSGNPPPIPSFIRLDAASGGVGESPMPHFRNSRDGNRISLASIFSFGGSSRRRAASLVSIERNFGPSIARKPSWMQRTGVNDKHDSSFGSHHSSSDSKDSHDKQRQPDQHGLVLGDKLSVTEEDYYNTYYSTLQRTPNLDASNPIQPTRKASAHSDSSLRYDTMGVMRQNPTSSSSGHPYAYAFSHHHIPDTPPPITAPPIPSPLIPFDPFADRSNPPPRLTFATPKPNSADGSQTHFQFGRSGVTSSPSPQKLKNSTSTPNFRDMTTLPRQPAPKQAPPAPTSTFVFPKGKEKWLSPETWCDAILLPRPRLKVKDCFAQRQGTDEERGAASTSSGRIVSPPVTPLAAEEFGMQQQQLYRSQGQPLLPPRQPGIASRVLVAHSRSLIDLNKRARYEGGGMGDPQSSRAPAGPSNLHQETSPRSMGFAQDDLALPTPVPSLSHVLEEGLLLEHERRVWQMQATNSFGNKHARSLSRSRSKSLTRKGRQTLQQQGNMEYLAAQACLGHQNLTPVIAPARLNTGYSDTSTGSGTRTRSDSLGNTLSKSSKSQPGHSRGHSRSDSWSQSAIKMAKSTVAICGYPVDGAPSESSSNTGSMKETQGHGYSTRDKPVSLEGALKRNETKVIRLADPALIPVDREVEVAPLNTQMLRPTRKTPSPSDISDSKVGVALGTPSPSLGESETDSMYVPVHPYAQGGFSFSQPSAESRHRQHSERKTDFAGPHPSVTPAQIPTISDILARHKLPPHLGLHPYAQQQQGTSSASTSVRDRDSYLDKSGLVGQYRSEDRAPHPSKMWAQLSPGVVREVLPGDIQYSPYASEIGHHGHGGASPDLADDDSVGFGNTMGVGETSTRYRDPPSIIEEERTLSSQTSEGDWAGTRDLDLPEFGQAVRRGVGQKTVLPSDRFWNRERFAVDSQMVDQHAYNMSANSGADTPVGQEMDREMSTSPTSRSPSPKLYPRPLGSPSDLEAFQDLFFRPGQARVNKPRTVLPETPTPPTTNIPGVVPWDISMRNRRTGSGLTSLARQLSEEFEAMAMERERGNSQYSQSGSSMRRSGSLTHRRDGSLQFVFEEVPQSASPIEEPEARIQAFQASGALPEDIESSRASSMMEKEESDEDATAMMRMGVVEPFSTPPVSISHHHTSYAGETASVHEHDDQDLTQRLGGPEDHARIVSGLHPPPTDATRSSYMTTSTASGMSGLSDFPVPPTTPKHMSLLTSYFNETLDQSQSPTEPMPPLPAPPPPVLLQDNQVIFGGDQDANELVRTLSTRR